MEKGSPGIASERVLRDLQDPHTVEAIGRVRQYVAGERQDMGERRQLDVRQYTAHRDGVHVPGGKSQLKCLVAIEKRRDHDQDVAVESEQIHDRGYQPVKDLKIRIHEVIPRRL